jgi:hypothetical protein
MSAPKSRRLYTDAEILQAGGDALGDRRPTEEEKEWIAAFLAPVRDQVLAMTKQPETSEQDAA